MTELSEYIYFWECVVMDTDTWFTKRTVFAIRQRCENYRHPMHDTIYGF